MSLHTLHGPAASDLARRDLAGRQRTAAGRSSAALVSRWQPSREGDSLSARPSLRLCQQPSKADLTA